MLNLYFYFILSSKSDKERSLREPNFRFDPSINSVEVRGFGTATTKIPARLAAFTPLGESSKTIAASFRTLSWSSANRNRSGFGFVLPGPTSSPQMIESK